MRIRLILAFTVFVTASLGVGALILDSHVTAREILYGRAQERADAFADAVELLAAPHLKAGGREGLERQLAVLAALPRVHSLEVRDKGGAVLLRTGAGAPSAESPMQARVEARRPSIDASTGETQGEVRVAFSTEGLRDGLRALFWRSIAFAALSVIALAAVSWCVGIALGRRIEVLADAVDRIGQEGPFDLEDGGTRSEVDRLARAFLSLHKRLRQEAAARRKLEAFKDGLADMLVHDLKHPLTVLNAVLTMLAEAGEGDPAQPKKDRLVAMAKGSLHRGNSMIEDLLQLARLNRMEVPLQKSRLPLAAFMEECARENAVIAAQFGRRWAVMVDPEAGARWIYGDKAMLKRLVGNLVLNAVEHTPPGSAVTLGARLCEKDRSKVEILVRDDGPGVPANRRETIFRKFGTFAESAKNVGLGLAFCKIVAEEHSARFDLVESDEAGTTFALTLPSSSGSGGGEESAPPEAAVLPGVGVDVAG